MKSDFKLIGTLFENDKEYKLYRDKKSNKVYKLFGDEVVLLEGNDLKAAIIGEKILNKVTKQKKFKKGMKMMVTIASIGLLSLASYDFYCDNENEINFFLTDSSSENDYNYLNLSLEKNPTITSENKKILNKYLKILSEKEIFNLRILAIGKRLEEYNFEYVNFTSEEMISVLENLLQLDDNGFVAKQLYAYVNDVNVDEETKAIANLFIFYSDVDKELLNLDAGGINYLIKKIHGISIDVNNLTDDDLAKINNINLKLRDNFSGDFTEEYQFNNNIFSEYKIFSFNDRFNYYGKIVDSVCYDYTNVVYYEKLVNLVLNEGNELDYNNPDDRMLVYLYANACLSFVELDSDITSFLYEGTKDTLVPPVISKGDLYEYLTNGTMDYSKLVYFKDMIFAGEKSLPLLQEVNLCLKKEVEVGNLDQELYNCFIESINDFYPIISYESWEKFVDCSLKGKSVDGFQLELLKTY